MDPAPFSLAFPAEWSLADVQRHLGNVPLERICAWPPPGTATESDLLALHQREGRICELLDGAVEKAMGSYQSALAMYLGMMLQGYLDDHPVGVVLGEAGLLRILPHRRRAPTFRSFFGNAFPTGVCRRRRLCRGARSGGRDPLAGNTPEEMQMKLEEYRSAGVRLIWYVYPEARSAVVHRADGGSEMIDESGTLDGGEVLPGFSFELRQLLDRFPGA